jgi:tetratricopeptide (TPR) repeat protein
MSEVANAPRKAKRLQWVLPVVGLLVLVGLGLVWYRYLHTASIAVPTVDLAAVDPAVVELIYKSCQEVREGSASPAAWGKLGQVYWVNAYWAEAVTCFQEAERLQPREPRWPYFQGVTLSLSDPERALSCLRRAATLAGDWPAAVHLRLGRALVEAGQTEEAEREFKHVLTIDSKNPHAHLELARLANAQGHSTEALQHLDALGDHRGTRRAAHCLRATIYFRNQNPQAEKEEILAQDLRPDPPGEDPFFEETDPLQVGRRGRLQLVQRYLDRDQRSEGLVLLRRLVKDYPDLDWCWLRLGRVLIQERDLQEAASAVQRALTLNPGLVDGHFYLGVLAFQRDDYEAAAASFARAAELKPDYALAYFNQGEALLRLRNPRGAIKAFQLALECKPHLMDAHLRLGQLLSETGNRASAVEHLRQVLLLDPKNQEVSALLAKLKAH